MNGTLHSSKSISIKKEGENEDVYWGGGGGGGSYPFI